MNSLVLSEEMMTSKKPVLSLPKGIVVFVSLLAALAVAAVYGGVRARQASADATRAYMRDVLGSYTTGLGVAEESRLAETILGESEAHNIDPLLVLALMKTESTFYNGSKSSRGAIGLMQILPSTGKEVAGKLSLEWRGDATLLDPYMNVKMGVYYFTVLKERYNDDNALTLAAYNAGPGKVNEMMRTGAAVGAGFSGRVLRHYKELKEKAEDYKNDRQRG